MNNNKGAIIGWSLVIFFVIACAAVTLSGYRQVLAEDPNFWSKYEALKSDPVYQAEQKAEGDAMVEKSRPWFVGLIILFAVLAFGGDVVKKVGVPLLFVIGMIAILGAIAYFWGWSDKNGDEKQDVQIIRVIQPSGNDAKNDMQYAKVNDINAGANVRNTISLVSIFAVFGIVVFLLSFAAQFFRRDW